jgi:hypothetical protein
MWAFTSPPSYGVSTNPTQGEHFINDRVDRNDTLVRESGQNTNDARALGVACVELRFTLLLGDDAPTARALSPFIDELVPHLKASDVDLECIDFKKPSLLLIEDFGTLGLQGAVDHDDGKNLSLFWRNIGESDKGGSRGGRWGLGKTVFANCSRISTWFGLTIRTNDSTPLLIGQVALRKHKVGKKTFQPHALFCASEPGQFELPISDPKKVNAFKSTFCLTRGAEPGLSVAVPFPHETITEKNLLKSAIQHFFFPILRGRMIIKINGRELNAITLRGLVAEMDCPELQGMALALTVAEEVCTLQPALIPVVDNADSYDFPNGKLGASAFKPDNLAKLKKSYQDGNLISIKLPFFIRPKKEDPSSTFIQLFLKYSPTLLRGQDFYLRDGVSVIEHRQFGEAEKAIGFLLADEESVSRFLGDAENPAHTAWNAKARGLEARYKSPQKSVMFIRHALRQFFDTIAKEEGVQDPNALVDFFFVPGQDGNPIPGLKRRVGESMPTPLPLPSVVPPPLLPSPRPKKLEISQIEGGFRVKAGKGLNTDDLPLTVVVKAAYEIRRGNPFQKYHRGDFEFERRPITIRPTDPSKVSEIESNGNMLSFQAVAQDFVIEVVGFDTHRDLKLASSISMEESTDDPEV